MSSPKKPTVVTHPLVSSIVHPLVQVKGGPKHPLAQIFDKDASKIPIIKSVAIMRLPQRNTFMSMVLHTQGDKVLKIEVGEPNLREIVLDEAKLEFVNKFVDEAFDEN